MRKNSQLEDLSMALSYYPPDWDLLCKHYFTFLEEHPTIALNESWRAKELSEMHLNLSLRAISEKYPEMNMHFDLHRQQRQTPKYQFVQDRVGRVEVQARTGRSICEYDSFAMINDLPVVFELKLRGIEKNATRHQENKKGIETNRPCKTIDAMKSSFYGPKLTPAEKHFEKKAGYALVVARDVYEMKQRYEAHSTWGKFLREGGIVVPFYTDRYQFIAEIAMEVGRRGLQHVRVG